MWPSHPLELGRGVNDTWNSFQRANKGRSVTTAEWKAAQLVLWAEHEKMAGLQQLQHQQQMQLKQLQHHHHHHHYERPAAAERERLSAMEGGGCHALGGGVDALGGGVDGARCAHCGADECAEDCAGYLHTHHTPYHTSECTAETFHSSSEQTFLDDETQIYSAGMKRCIEKYTVGDYSREFQAPTALNYLLAYEEENLAYASTTTDVKRAKVQNTMPGNWEACGRDECDYDFLE
jgi:hypothetical protein